jgi:hypothetical protein
MSELTAQHLGATPRQEAHDLFVALADTLAADFHAADFLETFVVGCSQVLGFEAAVLLVDNGGCLELAAASDERARSLARTELVLPASASAECLHSRNPVSRHGAVPAPGGAYSVHALPMRLREEIMGTLTLFRLAGGGLDADLAGLAQSLADAATISLLHQRTMLALDGRAAQLQSALDSRVLIEQAKGVLAERLGVTADEAFALLRGHARANNRKLRECAGAVVDGTLRITRPVAGGAAG